MKLMMVRSGHSWIHWCPGCKMIHQLPNIKGANGWTFVNGNHEKPTFTPSFKHTSNNPKRPSVCHYILTDGVLNYCSDSTHEMRDQQVLLPEIPQEYHGY